VPDLPLVLEPLLPRLPPLWVDLLPEVLAEPVCVPERPLVLEAALLPCGLEPLLLWLVLLPEVLLLPV